MLYIEKQGISKTGLWIYGRVAWQGLEVHSLFNTNLKEEVKSDKVEIKNLIIKSTKKGIRFEVDL